LILIKINQCTDDIELIKKQINNLKKVNEDSFKSFIDDFKQEIEEDLSTSFDGILFEF
jgi:hypothetical protein